MNPRTVTLGPHEADQRFDRWLRKLLRNMPLGAIMRHLRQGDVRIDGRKVAGSTRLVAGMVVEFRLPAADLAALDRDPPRASRGPAEAPALPAARRPRVVLADADLLVIDKPSGLAVVPGTGRENEHLVAWLDQEGFGTRTATFAPAPAHRLDRGTSGLVAIGLTPAGLRGLTAAFRDDRVTKVYLAVVAGKPPTLTGTVEAPLRVQADADRKGPKVVVAQDGQPARTDWTVLQQGGGCSLLRLVLHTGRTHQIRAHLRHLGCPIVGDRRYGGPPGPGDGFLLHAAELAFPHPLHGGPVTCTAPAPAAFVTCLGGPGR